MEPKNSNEPESVAQVEVPEAAGEGLRQPEPATGMIGAPMPTSTKSTFMVPWQQGLAHNVPGVPASARWDDISPYKNEPWIEFPTRRILQAFMPPGQEHGEGGWKLLQGWNQTERVKMVQDWIRQTWPTPFAMMQTIPSGEEDLAILFVAWVLGWNLSFGGRKFVPCALRRDAQGQLVYTGYRWNPFTRTCEKIG